MSTMAWVPGPSPKSLASGQIRDVVELFLHETGEVYAEASVVSLPIPEWNGNLVYVDTEQAEPRTIHGVLWATPFKDGIVRVAAFVLRKDHQNHGHGGQAWHMFQRAAVDEGYTHVQLEVKANNTGAQRFYNQRGLQVEQTLEGYYQSGLGYMMKGSLPRTLEG